MGKKKKNNKSEQRQVSQPPTDTSESALPELADTFGAIDLIPELGNTFEQLKAPSFAVKTSQRPLAAIGWGQTPEQHILKMNYDTNLARLCKEIGSDGYNYMAFPLGGLDRSAYKLPSDSNTSINPPPINLPDVQFDPYLWQTYIVGTISSWIDTDNPEPAVVEASMEGLRRELDHAIYLGIRMVIVPLLRVKSPNLMKLLNYYLWIRSVNFTVSILIPTRKTALLDAENLVDEDLFNLWVSTRGQLRNHSAERLAVGLKLLGDKMEDEFLVSNKYERWHGEPLHLFVLSTDSFVFSPPPPHLNSKLVEMVSAHRTLIFDLAISPELQRFLIMPEGQVWSAHRKQISDHLAPILNDKRGPDFSSRNGDRSLSDVLLLPMETVWKDLSCTEYESMEEDADKYKYYCDAISYELGNQNQIGLKDGLTIYILGAGRGGLVAPCLDIVKARFPHLHKIVNLYAVEKNPGACISLRYKNNLLWHGKVQIIEGDMRYVLNNPELPKAHLIISDLLGSFGDNELAPECLKGAANICSPSTVFVPQQYSSLLSPICCRRATDQLRDSFVSIFDSERAISARFNKETGKYVYTRPKYWTDHLYVSQLNRYHEASHPQEVFHIKSSKVIDSDNFEEHAELKYEIQGACEITGFLGHFVAVLAKNIYISNSSRYRAGVSVCSKSWFPCYLPLREEIRVCENSSIVLNFWRKCNDDGSWYEWEVTYKEYGTHEEKTTPLQNSNGESYFMPLRRPENDLSILL